MQNRKRDTDVYNRLLDSVGEGEGGMIWENSIETCILSRVKQITSPGWMHEPSAQTWCTGKTQRDGMGREVGGGIGMGNTCKSMADSFQRMTKPSTIKEKKKKEYWSGLPCPPPRDLPNPGIKPRSPTLQVDSLPAALPGNSMLWKQL